MFERLRAIVASMPTSLKRPLLASGASLLLSLAILFAAALPFKAELVSSDLRITSAGPMLPPQAAPPPGQEPGQPPGPALPQFLTGSFNLKIGKKIKGQRITFDRVVVFSESGKQLGTVDIGPVTRTIRLQETPGQPGTSSGSESVQGPLFLWPLEEGQVTFAAFAQRSFGVEPGARIYAQIEGDAGLRRFAIKTPVKPAQGFGPGVSR